MTKSAPLVVVVDDDESVRESLPDLLNELGFGSATFAAAAEFLDSSLIGETACLISDVAMPGMSGPELHRELVRRGYAIPTLFITAHQDFASRPDVLDGSTACLVKPFSDTTLQEALKIALKL